MLPVSGAFHVRDIEIPLGREDSIFIGKLSSIDRANAICYNFYKSVVNRYAFGKNSRNRCLFVVTGQIPGLHEDLGGENNNIG